MVEINESEPRVMQVRRRFANGNECEICTNVVPAPNNDTQDRYACECGLKIISISCKILLLIHNL